MKFKSTTRGLAAVYSGTFFSGAWAMIIPIIPVIALEFGVSAGAAAQIITAFAIGKFVGTVIAGIVLDRMGTRIALIGGPLTASLASLAASGAPWLSAILVLALIMGAADSLWSTAREVAAIDLARRNQRGRLISSLHGTYNMGAAISPFLGGWLTDIFNYKAAFIGYALATALSVVLGLVSPDSVVAPAPQKGVNRVKGWGFASVKRRLRSVAELFSVIRPDLRSTYLALVLATLASQSQRIVVQSMLPLYAGYYLDLSPTQIGMLFTISGVIVFMMIIPAGFLMDRVGRKWCTVPSTGLPALVFVLIPLTSNFTQLAILVGLAGLAQGLSLGSLATSTYDVVPSHARGRLQAVRRTIAELGSGMAPLLGGYLANTYNPGVPFLVYAPLLVFSATLLAVVGKETLER
ncbi:MAG: MFS transporter [Deltaproteobacteria bacterium]|nr:MFS transporter [Deltaproteobacteria bacterium]